MREQGKRKALVVDDEEEVRFFLQTALEDSGFDVDSAADGFEALEKIRADPPDVISLDLVMPRKSGARLLYELRRNNEWKHIPVILVTAHSKDDLGRGDFEDVMSGRAIQGPETYLEKPVTAETYVRSIMRALGIDTLSGQQDVKDSDPSLKNMREEVRQLIGRADSRKLQEILKMLDDK